MCINTIANCTNITVDGEPLEFVDDFTYLGTIVVSSNNGAQKDIKARLAKIDAQMPICIAIWLKNVGEEMFGLIKISNVELYKRNDWNSAVQETKHRRLHWHVLRSRAIVQKQGS
ncbi:Uncharacterised protein r2_g2147 [Pycnogonum litorale]